MITEEERIKIKNIRTLCEQGKDKQVSKHDRQWILDVFKREGVPLDKAAYDGAKELGFDVEGIKVKDSD